MLAGNPRPRPDDPISLTPPYLGVRRAKWIPAPTPMALAAANALAAQFQHSVLGSAGRLRLTLPVRWPLIAVFTLSLAFLALRRVMHNPGRACVPGVMVQCGHWPRERIQYALPGARCSSIEAEGELEERPLGGRLRIILAPDRMIRFLCSGEAQAATSPLLKAA